MADFDRRRATSAGERSARARRQWPARPVVGGVLLAALVLVTAAGTALGFGPSHDLFAYAEQLSGASGSDASWTAEATKETGEPAHAGQPGGASVWYTWTPATTGTATFVTNGSNYDTLLAVYLGRRVNNLTLVAADDNGAGSEIGTSKLSFTATAGVEYMIAVDARDGYTPQGSQVILTWNRPIPVNDNRASATLLSGQSGSTTGTNVNATTEPGEPGTNNSIAPMSVWYRWTAPSSGQYSFNTTGSTADVGLTVFTGNSIPTLNEIAAGGDPGSGAGQVARLVFGATIGTTYHVSVTRDPTDGPFTINWTPVTPPPNDAFASPTVLSGHSGTIAGTTFGATREAGESYHDTPFGDAGRTIWYRWTAPADGAIRFDTEASPGGTIVVAYKGTTLSGLTQAGSSGQSGDDGDVWLDATRGTTYRIVVDSRGGSAGPIQLRWTWQPPGNDDVFAAIFLGDWSGTRTGNNILATAQPGEPAHAGQTARRSIWYGFESLDGTLTVDTLGSGFDTVVAVYRGSALGGLTLVGSNDDATGRTTSRLSVSIREGFRYSIAIDGKGGASGAITLAWSFSAGPPANDRFAAAQPISGLEGSVRGRTIAATTEIGEPVHAAVAGGRSIWYRWVSPVNGRAMFTTAPWSHFGTNVDTLLAVYRGSSVTALTQVTANDDYPLASGTSRVHFAVTKGATYYIAVDAESGAPGYVVLRWTTPPLNDELANAATIAGRSGTETGTTLRATNQAYEIAIVGNGDGSVWYRWTAPVSEVVEMTGDTSSFAPGMDVFTGSGLIDKLSLVPLSVDVVTGELTRIRFAARAGTVYWIALRSDGAGAFTFAWRPVGAPSNDRFASPRILAGETGTTRMATLLATNEFGEPPHDEEYGGFRTVWFSWTAPRSGTFSFDTAGTDFPTVVAVYAGDRLDALRPIATHHNGNAPHSTRVRAGVTAGTTYRIAVGGAGGYFEPPGGNLVLNWRLAAAPANDRWATATVLAGAGGTLTATNNEASREAGEPVIANRPGGASIWFRWTAPANGAVSFEASGASLDTLLGVYRGTSVGALALVRANNNAAIGVLASRVSFVATAGQQYSIVVDTISSQYVDVPGVTGSITLRWRQPATPPNDSFAMATRVDVDGPVFRLLLDVDDNRNATREPGEPLHAGVSGGRSVWYRWTAPLDDFYRVHTRGSGFDTVLGVYTGARVDALTLVGANDNAFGSGTSAVDFSGIDGQTYWIAVDGKGGATGDLVLSLNFAIVPDNDHFVAAQALSGSSGRVEADNRAASAQGFEPHHAFWGANQSVWYRWTAPASGTWAFTSFGERVDTLLAVYTGSTLATLAPLADTELTTVRIGAVAGTTYRIAVDAFGNGGNFSLSWAQVAAPANDNQAAAVTLASSGGTLTGTTVGTSRQAGEPRHAGNRGTSSAWYRWTAPASGTLTVDTAGSAFDTVLGVYTGSGIGALVERASNDDSGTSRTSRVRLAVAKGTVYWIAVDGVNPTQFYSGGAAGSLKLTWLLAAPPTNDAFAAATALSASGSVTASNVGARKEPGEPDHAGVAGGASVWYRWTAPSSGTLIVNSSRSAFATALGVYTGTTVEALAVVRRSDDSPALAERIIFAVTAGVTYRIAVDGVAGATGAVGLDWRMAAPENNAFAAAQVITARTGEARGSNAGATRESGEPAHAGVAGGRSIWYRWTAPATESITMSTAGTAFDTLLAVYTGSSVSGLARVAANDDAAGLRQSMLTFEAVAGRVYVVAIDGKAGVSGSTVLSWRPTPDPPNNEFVEAAAIAGAAGATIDTTFAADREAGEPDHAAAGGRHSVWYRWTAPSTGVVTFATEDIRFDTVLAVYRGSSVAGLTRVVSDNNSGGGGRSKVSFSPTPGAVYLIAVDGVGDEMGAFMLTWNLPPPNDAFTAAVSISATGGSITGSTVAATAEPGEPEHTSWGARQSIWYRWTAPADGAVELAVSSTTAGYEPFIAVYVGDRLDALRVAGANQQGLRIPVFAGTTYRIAIDGLGASPNVTLTWQPTATPSNDNFAAATTLTGLTGTVAGTVVGATREIGEPWHAYVGNGASVWYRWTAPSSGDLCLDTLGTSAFWSVLAVYQGTRVDALTLMASNSGYWGDQAAFVRFPIVAGQTYWIAVDTSGGRGAFTLNWLRTDPL